MPKLARLCRLNDSPTKEISFPDGSTVDDVLTHFGQTLVKGESLHIDGEPVDGSDEFEDGDVIYIVPSTTGA